MTIISRGLLKPVEFPEAELTVESTLHLQDTLIVHSAFFSGLIAVVFSIVLHFFHYFFKGVCVIVTILDVGFVVM